MKYIIQFRDGKYYREISGFGGWTAKEAEATRFDKQQDAELALSRHSFEKLRVFEVES